MITIFHMLELAGLLVGALFGAISGAAYGVIGCLVGLVAGGMLGFAIGNLPGAVLGAILKAQLRKQSSDDLRASIRNGECPLVNLVTLELRSRGEDMPQDLEFILELLSSIHHGDRCTGWAAMTTAFPELSSDRGDYVAVNQMSVDQAERFRNLYRSLTVAAR